MARITRVAKAQQRYVQVPVIDPETGEQKKTPVMRHGKQRMTKKGQPIFLSVTQDDKSQPLPLRKCGKCGKDIEVNSPYKHISIKSTYGGRTLYRCVACPDWHVWEYSSSLSARVAEISYDFWGEQTGWESSDDVTEALNSTAERVREIAQEKEESADNIESGFQHETQMSQDLRDVSEQLNSWADEIEQVDVPDYPEPEEQDCDDCEGTGDVDNDDYTNTQEEILKLTQQKTISETQLRLLHERHGLDLITTDEFEMIPKLEGRITLLKRMVGELVTKLENTEATKTCETCDGSGRIEPDEPTEEQLDEWRQEVQDACSIVDECPV